MINYKFIPLKVRIQIHLTEMMLRARFNNEKDEISIIYKSIQSLDLL